MFGGTTDVNLNNFNASNWDVEVLVGNGRIVRGAGANNVIDLSGFTDVITRLDRIDGGIGDDTITGVNLDDLRGADTIYGGANNDKLYGLKGNDVLKGDAGDDTIEGGDGIDQIEGGDGIDILDGNAGDDIFYIQGMDAKGDTIRGGADSDAIAVYGLKTTNLTLTNFNSQDNTINFDPDASGPLASINVVGSSIERWSGSGQNVVGDAANNYLNFSNIELLIPVSAPKAMGYIDGLAGNDIIFGTQLDDDIRGGNGNDQLDGQDGNDTITGGAGVDTIFGGNGNDTITGGADYDYISGGAGNDKFMIAGAEAVFDDLFGDAGTVDEIVVTGTAAVTLHHFSTVTYSIEKWTGNGKGVLGTTGDDVLDFSNLTVVGSMGTIDGGAGNDTISSSFNSDRIVTGVGDDTVIYKAGFGIDTIADFAAGGTNDQIDLSSFTDIRNLTDLQGKIFLDGTASSPLSFKFNNDDYLNLEKVKFSQLTADDFIFYDPAAAPPV